MKTIRSLQQSIRKGEITPTMLVERCLERIQKLEPLIHAWEILDPVQARKDAKALETELKNGQDRGPLHGIPVGVKDIIDVNDLPTRAGCKSWTRNLAQQDADCISLLRKAGAIFLGKTVTTAYASFDPPPTANPWNLEKTPGGSSSGSAASVATGMVGIALGSQTGGSVTRPASFCGVYSMKPTYGWVSMDGIVPLAPSMDHLGFMATNIDDLRLLYEALSTSPAPNPGQLQSPTLGLLKGFFWDLLDKELQGKLQDIQSVLKQQGVAITEVPLPANAPDIIMHHRRIMAFEAFKVHAYWIERRPLDYPEKITSLIDEGSRIPRIEYLEALHQKEVWKSWFESQMTSLDGLMLSATATVAPEKVTTGDPVFNSPWSFTGMPTVSLPAGLSREGLPYSLQIVGKQNQDARLLDLGSLLEKHIPWDQVLPSHLSRFL